MATLQSKTTKNAPVAVIYPAEKPSGGTVVRCRVGKKSVLPAFGADSLDHLLQLQLAGRIMMLLVSDVLQSRFMERIRNAYNWLGQMEIDEDAKLSRAETARVVDWLKAQRQGLGYYDP
jgi:hypothetical protein